MVRQCKEKSMPVGMGFGLWEALNRLMAIRSLQGTAWHGKAVQSLMWQRRCSHLILFFGEQSLVRVDELQVGGGGDVDMAPLLSQEALAQLLHALVEQHAQLWHLSTHLQASRS